jgi:hypothetical protein
VSERFKYCEPERHKLRLDSINEVRDAAGFRVVLDQGILFDVYAENTGQVDITVSHSQPNFAWYDQKSAYSVPPGIRRLLFTFKPEDNEDNFFIVFANGYAADNGPGHAYKVISGANKMYCRMEWFDTSTKVEVIAH